MSTIVVFVVKLQRQWEYVSIYCIHLFFVNNIITCMRPIILLNWSTNTLMRNNMELSRRKVACYNYRHSSNWF